MADTLDNYIGKVITVFFQATTGQQFTYVGKLIGFDLTSISILDRKEGAIMLPRNSCRIKLGVTD